MKKQISQYKLALVFILLSANTMAFAQRGERGGDRGGRPSGNQPQQRAPEARQMPQRPERAMPGRSSAPTMERSRGQRESQTAMPQNRQPNPVIQRPDNRQRPSSIPRSNPTVQQPQRSAPNVVNDNRWNNRGSNSNRSVYDNRVIVNNNRSRNVTNSYGGGRNYSIGNRNYNYRYNNNYYYRPRPSYSRPPVIWQGRSFYTHYNYNYHPYRPYYYGSFFHPFGYFTASLGAAAFMFSWNNQYYGYDQGVYYAPYNGGYHVIPAPVGASVNSLPSGFVPVQVDNDTYYYFAGVFYINEGNGYEIVAAPPGAVVYDLPEGAKEVTINDTVYIDYNGTYFQPIYLNGRNGYEVVDTEEDDNF